ncbi:MAG: Hsp20/alpha crystallin family protein [Anaerolineae bacterium]
MSLMRWQPFEELMSLRDAMDRLFEESIVWPRSWLAPAAQNFAVDIYETKDDVVVKASLPGAKPEDVEVSVVGDTLTIKGEVKEEKDIKEENYIRKERRYGSFCRSFTLPVSVNPDKATAEFENGVLTLTLPKAEEVKPKTIAIKAKK